MDFITSGKTNWNYIIIVALVAIIVAAGILWYVDQGLNTSYQQALSLANNSSVASQNAVVDGLTYGEAVKLYEGRRIQFNSDCVTTPSYLVFKPGVTIMLDNRYDKTRTISLDGKTYDIAPYSFSFITLTTSYALPHTVTVDCGTGKNNGTILLEK